MGELNGTNNNIYMKHNTGESSGNLNRANNNTDADLNISGLNRTDLIIDDHLYAIIKVKFFRQDFINVALEPSR